MHKLSDAAVGNLRDIAQGLSRGRSARSCESLVTRGLVVGDWITGYYVTARGLDVLARAEAPKEKWVHGVRLCDRNEEA
jgi:hypothetical protein